MNCYVHLHQNAKNGAPVPGDAVACSVKCAKAAKKSIESGAGDGRATWETDGKNGPEDPLTSMQILMDWWSTPPNYEKYRGKNNSGQTKIKFAADLAEKMKRETVSEDRTAEAVAEQIRTIEKKWREAHNFAESETGAGLQEHDPSSFEEAVLKKCKYYYILKDIMIDRA